MEQNKIWMLPVLFLLALGFVNAACTTSAGSNSTDYYGVNVNAANTTAMTTTQFFGSYTAFTPIANFSVNVSEVILAGESTTNNTLRWQNNYNFSNRLWLLNGTDLVPPSNYTLINRTNTNWYINWKVDDYNNTNITVWFLKNFTKNVDDLVLNYTQIYNGSTVSNFLTQNTIVNYGDDKTFLFTPTSLGQYLNNTNWAVTWGYTTLTCSLDEPTVSGIAKTKTLVYAGLALIAVLILVTIAWALIQLFQGTGSVDFMTVTIAAIGGGIIILLAYIIIYYVALGLGA